MRLKKSTPVMKPAMKKKVPVESSDDDDDDDDDDDEDSVDNGVDNTTALKGVMENIKQFGGNAESDDEDDDDDDEEEEDDDVDNDSVLQTKKRKVESSADIPAKKTKTEFISIFMGGLNKDSTPESIKQFFTKKGVTVLEVRKKQGKKFGHCDLSTKEDLVKAVNLDGKKIDGVNVNIAEATSARPDFDAPKRAKVGKKTLVVRNLQYAVTENELLENFKGALEARIPVFPDTGKSRGKGFVDFPTVDDAKQSQIKMHGKKIRGRAIYVEFAPESGKGPGAKDGEVLKEKKRKPKIKNKVFTENQFEDDSD
ncbi:hypothetical protein LOTGIDRAFT_229264 [Lottia gigantea]|uniref:RRM domain-containing protein n=1 Tax=Lottia gigantea TaxID=225164 RepID=V4A1D8_LOTGI|nr:hypothetical protein LOTGIDRAFT_229264 [Lottia gigantea]ESO87106.1 hypothetical protein LOTGIDRAFT_229264 [Lottia gigantea]